MEKHRISHKNRCGHGEDARNYEITKNSGAFYFSGRDDKYRPIIVADIGKFDADDVDTIPRVLAVVM
jgi:hypothetical protein